MWKLVGVFSLKSDLLWLKSCRHGPADGDLDEGVSTGKTGQAVLEFKAPICAMWTEFRLLHIVLWLLSVCFRGETCLIVQFLSQTSSCLVMFVDILVSFYFIWELNLFLPNVWFLINSADVFCHDCHLLIQSSSWVGDAHSLKCGQLLPERRDSHSPLRLRVWL